MRLLPGHGSRRRFSGLVLLAWLAHPSVLPYAKAKCCFRTATCRETGGSAKRTKANEHWTKSRCGLVFGAGEAVAYFGHMNSGHARQNGVWPAHGAGIHQRTFGHCLPFLT